MANSEVVKLQQHLSLLKQEYSKLQTKYRDLESRFAYISSANGTTIDCDLSNNFASKLVDTVSSLHESETYSDIVFKLSDHTEIPGHKIVLTSRSKEWNEEFLKNIKELDWSNINLEVAKSIILWLYKSELHLTSENLTLELIKTAFDFNLDALIELCEQHLISIVNLRSCVKFYSVAEEVHAANLREYCSGLISTYWDDLNASDFEHMSGPLLYQMLKNKTPLPLHSAVRLQREDVVFLCLVENSSRLSDIVNLWSQQGELPLDIALRNENESIAVTLIQHNADINIRDLNGDCLLHRSLKRCDPFATLFLLDHNCDVTLSTRNENDFALHLVAKLLSLEQSSKIAMKLLNKNVNINAQNKFGCTALHLAVKNENNEIFDLLIKQPEINLNLQTIDEHSILYFALEKYEQNQFNYAETLIRFIDVEKIELNPIYQSKNNINLLQLLIIEGHEKAASYLVKFLKDFFNHVNADGETALHLACLNGYEKLIQDLLKLGANCNLLTNELRQSPLHYAVKGNSLQCIQVIIEFNNSIKMKNEEQDIKTMNEYDSRLANFNIRDTNGDTPICLAVNENHNELIPILIEGGADVNVRNGRDFTLLHQAIMKEDAETAVFLLKQNGIEINAKTPENETPLQLAIHYRLVDVVDALCTKGVDMSAPDRLGNCALWSALDTGKEEIAQILVRHGADTDCWENGPDGCRQTLLHRAIDENKETAAIFLIQSGCDLDSPRIPGANGEGGEEAFDNQTPLHLCCQWGLEDVARTLIEYRANVNAKDATLKTPLHVAIENQHSAIIFMLLSVPEIDLTIRDKNGLSAFAAALTFRNNKAAQAILEKLPSAAEQYDSKGQNFLHVAIKKNDIESALFLLTVNVDVNSRVQDTLLTPPIHLAAKFGNETLVRSLILAGARVNERDSQKRTALHIASESGNIAAVSALLQNNADYDAVDFSNDNSLHIAVREGHLNVVRTLLTESSINAEHVNFKGRNPLHELCKYGKENAASICELFLESMPNFPINTCDINGNSPLLLAYMNGNSNLCRLLVKAKACLGTENCDKISIFNYQVPSKQLLNKLLDSLEQPATWTSTESCQECGKGFSITIRTHHCRHCGRALCSKCSDQEVPIIKFGENRPVRVCQVCFNVLKMGSS